MELSLRLEGLLSEVEPCHHLADVGCDHAFVSIEAVQRGLCQKAYACDVRKGPLLRAKEHVEKAGLEGQIQLVQTDGLDYFREGDLDGAVLAGMGGLLTVSILKRAVENGKGALSSVKQLVLQPQSEWETVRRFLEEIYFAPDREAMVKDRGKFYWILHCVPSDARYEREWQYRYGSFLVRKRDPVLREYLQKKRRTDEALIKELEKSAGEGASAMAALKKEKLTQQVGEIDEVLRQWD